MEQITENVKGGIRLLEEEFKTIWGMNLTQKAGQRFYNTHDTENSSFPERSEAFKEIMFW